VKRSGFFCLIALLASSGLQQTAIAQQQVPPGIQFVQSASPPPLKDPATYDQICEYLRLSGDMESFRQSWIAAVDKNRSIGAPYWPESFWTAVKDEMRKTDLTPMFVTLYQHGVSKELMQEVLDALHRLGVDRFRESPEFFQLGEAWSKMAAEMDQLKRAKTQEVVTKVYAVYKTQIKAARAKYLAEHPDWKDK
jgi:hypothetical protein